MSFKLAIRNIKKSIKDYSIYFFTLFFAVALFYMFNSIDAQSSMLSLSTSKETIINSLVTIINYVSVFVSVILGFLIVYSNNFIIRRRKKELGMYEILGMSQAKVSFIIVLETVFVGLLALAFGLAIGVMLSQFISVFIAKLFAVNVGSLKFVFSTAACTKTILYFGIIFLLVIIFNILTLKRYKIIDLINADKKQEKSKVRNTFVIIITFILASACLGYAYYLLLKCDALIMMDEKLWIMIASGAMGTFFLFFSLSGFILQITEKIKKIYYKDLNIFTLKQVNNQINTSVFSTTIICLMLLLTIGLLSSSMSMVRVFNSGIQDNNLTDFTFQIYDSVVVIDNEKGNIVKKYNVYDDLEHIIDQDVAKKYVTESLLLVKYKDDNIVLNSILTDDGINTLNKKYGGQISLDYHLPIIKESDYQKFMKLTHQPYIDINNNEYLILENLNVIYDIIQDYYSNGGTVTVNGTELIPSTNSIVKTAIENSSSSSNDGVVVVSDKLVNNLEILGVNYIGNFVANDDEEQISTDFYKAMSSSQAFKGGYAYTSKVEAINASLGIKVMATFLGLYLGMIFAISSATILAIGQLSSASDNKKRYKVLNQIGADRKMLNKALFTQELIIFAFPLVIALIHSYFGLREINNLLYILGDLNLSSNIFLTTLFMVIVYGGYFIVTYLCSKEIIKK